MEKELPSNSKGREKKSRKATTFKRKLELYVFWAGGLFPPWGTGGGKEHTEGGTTSLGKKRGVIYPPITRKEGGGMNEF